ncbi:hypothetical protein [Gimesia fumaroli]|uniref:Uncharacterized protein n=1 Tax=Gimesia fumaroli TaxID=2527976 RepID=A0A518IGC6_9PLAN|nr:hypothetical protein [Gimesia fumaroli]QDV52137.1 hypothetical protein Enr17x_41970 [Gimesia fumaroli]
MPEEEKKGQRLGRVCPVCKGTGLDKTAHRRYTTGGHDDRSCSSCHGECYIYEDDEMQGHSDY